MKNEVLRLLGFFLIILWGNEVFGQNDISIRIATSSSDPTDDTHAWLIKHEENGINYNYALKKLPLKIDTEVYCWLTFKGKNIHESQLKTTASCAFEGYPRWKRYELDAFHEEAPRGDQWQSGLFILVPGMSALHVIGEINHSQDAQIDSLIINFFKPDPDFVAEKPIAWAMSRVEARDNECGCPVPQHVTRQGWGCPDGNNPSCANPVTTQVTHLIVHHSATSNTSANWANTVRSIWNYHTGTNGWCDIGYNWVIDPNGVIYQGRGGGDNIRGAHFCGTNTGTMGICLLGDYRVDTPTAPMMRSLERLLAWKGCKEQLAVLDSGLHNASSRTLPFVTGHRLGCNTTCPGDEVYNRLGFARSNTADSIDACPIISSVDEPFALKANIFPNPASDHITLDYNAPLDKIQLFNSLGQLVKNISPEKRRISLSGLPPGKYLLRCTKDDTERSFPFLLP